MTRKDENRRKEWEAMCDEIFASLDDLEQVAKFAKVSILEADKASAAQLTSINKKLTDVFRDVEGLIGDAEFHLKMNEIEDFIYAPKLELVS